MFLTLENILLVGSLLLILSVFFSKSSKYGIPTVVLFILIGMLAGADGLGKIDFFDIHLSKFIGTLALILILFSGGLDTRFSDIRPVLIQGALLSTVGVVITAAVTGLFISYVTHMTLLEGLLLGSIISSTDAASVFTILRAKNTGLKGKIRPLLELEILPRSPMVNKTLVSMSIPKDVLISMVTREDILFVPDGTTVFRVGDKLTVMTDTSESLDRFREMMVTE